MQQRFIALAIMLIFSVPVSAQYWSGIIDSTRAIDWTTAGAPSIDARVTVCTTLSSSATAAQINTALTNCPAGETVLLNPGTYTISSAITIPSNRTLRGSGPDQTILQFTGTGGVQFGSGSEPSAGTNTNITGGTSQGSNSITVASASGISVGTLLMLTQNDLSYMTNVGSSGTCDWCNGGIGGNSGQVVQVTNVAGTTLTIDPPLYIAYSSSPKAYRYTAGCVAGGLENLQLYATNSGVNPMINFDGVIDSWVSNVESNFADGAHLYLSYSLHNTVRNSYFHDGFNHGPGGTDDQLGIQYKSSANLIINNIFWRQHVSVLLEWGASGNVIAYNYSTGNYHENWLSWFITDFNFHGAHPMMNLFEGNVGDKFQPDTTWGSSSHSTVFRNWFRGSRQYVPPLNARGALQIGSASWEDANTYAYAIDYLSQYNNMVGNISGSTHLLDSGAVNSLISPVPSAGIAACYRVGYNSDNDAAVTPNNAYTTIFWHGIYNCITGAFDWDSGHPDHALPSSFFLASKPAWFGAATWPPIGPDVTGGTGPNGHAYAIPAQTCWATVTSNGTSNTGPFNADTCYASTSAPAVSLSPGSHDFGTQQIGATSSSSPIQLTNSGDATLNISSITISGDFAIFTNTCGSTLAASASCTVSPNFTPTVSGSRTGTLTFNTDASTSPDTVSLSGTGAALKWASGLTITGVKTQ